MIEPDVIEPDVIEPEPVPATPAARFSRRRRAVVAGVTLLAVVAGGVAITAGGGGDRKAAPLALLAGSGSQAEGRSMAASAPEPAVPSSATADGRAVAPYPVGGWGLEFRVDGHLPDLPDHAAAWNVSGPALDKADVARIAGALGVTGDPVARDSGWFVDDGDWTLSATPAGDAWSVSLYRSRFAAVDDAATAAAAEPTGPALSAPEAEQRVRDLVDRMGAPAAHWQAQVTETEIGPGWACASPAPAMPGELTKEEVDKFRLEANPAVDPAPPTASGAGQAASGKPAVGGGSPPACPPPPAPVKGFTVGLFPILDGHRAEWAVWNVTLRADGRVENLYGAWAGFDRAGDYKLRTVDSALKDLTSGPRPMPLVSGGAIAEDTPAAAPAEPNAATVEAPPVASSTTAPAAPDCPVATPLPPEKVTSSLMPACAPMKPQVVTITGVELGLLQAPVYEAGKTRMMLVPAYRFLGHFDNGSAWESSVIALDPSAIAPPPNIPVPVDSRESGGKGATVR